MMRKIKKREVLRTKINAYISFEAFDKLEELSEEYNISKSRLIEASILAMYGALKKKQGNNDQATQKEATAEAR